MRFSPVAPLAILKAVREIRRGAGDERPVVVAGARELAPVLVRELTAGGEARAVREGAPGSGASVVVYVLGGAVTPEVEAELRDADRADVPLVAVVPDGTDALTIPYVLANDVVAVPRGSGFPVEEIARAVARKLGDDGTWLAARLPVLRDAVCDDLVSRVARQNALLAAMPAAGTAILTLNQIRLVLRLAAAHGLEIDNARAAEILGVLGAGVGFRAVAREAAGLVPGPGWALRGAVAYVGTRALGEAATRYFAAGAPLSVIPTPRP